MRFKEVLNKYGLTQAELAERLKINRVSVSRLFRETNDMRASTLVKIADAIGCDVGEFFRDPETIEAKDRKDFIAIVKNGDDCFTATSIDELESIVKHIKG